MKNKFKKLLGLVALVFTAKKAFDLAKKKKEEKEEEEENNGEEDKTVDVEN